MMVTHNAFSRPRLLRCCCYRYCNSNSCRTINYAGTSASSSLHSQSFDNDSSEKTRQTTKRLLSGVLDRLDRSLSYKANISKPTTVQSTVNINVDDSIREIIADVRKESLNTNVERVIFDSDQVNVLLHGVMDRSLQTISSTNVKNDVNTERSSISPVHTNNQKNGSGPPVDYSNNPTITTTALAHSLWSYTLRPGIDTAIDATAGNGGDSVAIARLLFPSYIDTATHKDDVDETLEPSSATISQSQLFVIDIQEAACHNTTEKLSAVLPPQVLQNNVRVCHASHATLPIPNDTSSIALVVYNLGFLPGSKSKDLVTTTTTSTVASMAHAATLLRLGGMLSVTTYPRTNHEEDTAVRAFMEGLALFSSMTQSWSEYILESTNVQSPLVRDQLAMTLRQVYEDNPLQKWRVTEHKKLGRIDAPILFTAIRIQ
jgi:Putative rRNA methylase